MKLIDADKFAQDLEDWAITDTDRDFCRKVRFALAKTTPIEAIPIAFVDHYRERRPGFVASAIRMIKDAWEREQNGQGKSDHNTGSQGTGNVSADRPHADGIGTAPDRGLRTAEGLQPDGVFCISKNAGRRKGTPRDRITNAVREIDNLIDVAEPIEEVDDISHKAENISEYARMIGDHMAAKNYQAVTALAEGCEMFAERADQSAENVGIVIRRIMTKVGEIRAALAEKELGKWDEEKTR